MDCRYAICLKINQKFKELVARETEALNLSVTKSGYATKDNIIYGEMMYKAMTWDCPRRTVYKREGLPDSFLVAYTFIGTSMDDQSPKEMIDFYLKRGSMENFIKECKTVSVLR